MKNLTIITNKYPNQLEPNVLVFVQQLVWAIADSGVECNVICPMPININPKYLKFPDEKIEKTENGNRVRVIMPKYIGFGQSNILGYNPAKITTKNFTDAVIRVIEDMNEKPDAVYGHFVTPAGIAAARVGKRFNIPSFMAYGEATYNTIKHFGLDGVREEFKSLNGVVAVSTKNKNMLVSENIVEDSKIGIFPNGFRPERFYPRSKKESREKFGLPQDKFIVSFVGSYDHRKGIKRLEKAVDNLDDIYFISAGKGELEPKGKKCLYSGPVDNEDLPYFYSASDAFVLPTLNEGCSNAIIEAIACDLPIISSNMPFNEDILDETNSILVDPNNVNEIKNALRLLKDNKELMKNLQQGSLEKSKMLTLNIRANKILQFIESKVVTYGY